MNENIKKFILSQTEFPRDAKYVIYGTQEIAKAYYNIICELYGDNEIEFFIDGSLQAPEEFCGCPVINIEQLKLYKNDNQMYIIAAFHSEQDRMLDNLKKCGIDNSKIIPLITYFRDDYIAKYLEKSKDIYFYEEFNNISEIEEWIEEADYYLNCDNIDITFNYVCKEVEKSERIKSQKVHIVKHEFQYPQKTDDIIIVRNFQNIYEVQKNFNNPILCVDNHFNIHTKTYVYAAISNFAYGIPDYQRFYQNNFKRLLTEAALSEGVLICGNGPSLGEGILKSEKLCRDLFPIVCNNLYQIEDLIEKIDPKCYTLSDQYFFRYDRREMLRDIINYINQNDCFLIFPKKWERLVVENLKIDKDKMIALDFVRDQVCIPSINNLNCCPSGTVVLTMGVPIGISCHKDIYFVGCDGQKREKNEIKWEFQKGMYEEKLEDENSFICPSSKGRNRITMEMDNSYKKLLQEVEKYGNTYYTITHSNFSILEKKYLEL